MPGSLRFSGSLAESCEAIGGRKATLYGHRAWIGKTDVSRTWNGAVRFDPFSGQMGASYSC